MEKRKTAVADVNRTLYDIKDRPNSRYQTAKGLSEAVILDISAQKNEPDWMLSLRLAALETYHKTPLPAWGPPLSALDMDKIVTYVRPLGNLTARWEDVPADIRETFQRLGIPQAEQTALAGVGAQYDSEVVYHSIQEDMARRGVVYTDMDTAVREYESIVRPLFMQLVKPNSHKFAALHGAVWSGGSFVYVPAGVSVEIPLQSYFRLNAPGAGQFEHTLIVVEEGASLHFIEGCSAPKYSVVNLHAGCVELFVRKNAKLRYSTIENWSKNMMNLNTKRALVDENGTIDWVSGTFGSHTTMLYPASILQGEGATSSFTGVTFASEGQHLDTGSSVIHAAPNTTSTVNARSIAKDGGISVYRSSVNILPAAENAKSSVICESLMLDAVSRTDTIPVLDVENPSADIGHEAKIGKISDTSVFYLMSRGLSEAEAKAMIVRGFVEPVTKELPLEYAVEMNRLVTIELEGSIG